MYNLVVDFGNTAIKYGLFQQDQLMRMGYVQEERELLQMPELAQVLNLIVSSVRAVESELATFLNIAGSYVQLNYQTPMPVVNLYDTPHTLGMDRLAAAIGANFLYPTSDCLVIDAGTAITYDFIDREKQFHGGSIAPGLEMKFKALHTFTQKLPLVSSKADTIPLAGKNTAEAIQSGVLNGTVAEVEGFINAYKQKSTDLVVVLCGGDAAFFETNIKEHIFVVPELVLIGLNRILNYNA